MPHRYFTTDISGGTAVLSGDVYKRQVENTPDSVFCSHGAGYPVKWNEAPAQMHIQLK